MSPSLATGRRLHVVTVRKEAMVNAIVVVRPLILRRTVYHTIQDTYNQKKTLRRKVYETYAAYGLSLSVRELVDMLHHDNRKQQISIKSGPHHKKTRKKSLEEQTE